MTLQKYFSHPSLVIHFFCNPAKKTETGIANRWGTTNSKPARPIIMMGQSENWAAVTSCFLHCFMQVHAFAVPFTSYRKLWNYSEPKPFSSAKPACFYFSSSNFAVQDHILSTAGDALIMLLLYIPTFFNAFIGSAHRVETTHLCKIWAQILAWTTQCASDISSTMCAYDWMECCI